MAYVDSLNKEEKYMQRAKAMFDDDGSGNTGIEIIRLNKKFDIFMKRFMRAEEDIKEVKQNFYRVMHCAFAKYEQGLRELGERGVRVFALGRDRRALARTSRYTHAFALIEKPPPGRESAPIAMAEAALGKPV
jgi:hypothetical protein